MRKLFASLRFRLVLLVLIAALPALALMIYSGMEQRRQAASTVQNEVLRMAHLATINQETFVENTRVFLVALSHMPAMRASDLKECQDLFSHLFTEHYPQYASFYVADLNANIVCHAPNTHIPDHLDECEHYKMALATHDFVVSNYHICRGTGKAILSMAYPVDDDQGNFIRVINISMDLSWINELASQAKLPAGSTLAVLDDEGTFLTHYPDPEQWIGTTLPEDSLIYPLYMQGEGTLVAEGPDSIQRIYAMTPMESGQGSVKVIMGIPTEVAYAEANRTLLRNLLFLGVATLMAAAAAFILAELFIMRQTRSLLQTTEQLASGDLSARTSIPHDQGELGQLAGSFDLMASALEQRKLERDRAETAMQDYAAELERSNRELQDFANIASHDMQEPLRKILTFSELLQKRYSGVIDERGQDYLDRMDYSAHRLYDLINDLLAYSRVTTRAQPFIQVDLNEVVRKVINDLDLQIEQSGAKVNITSLPTLEADPTQMYQLLQNLVSNALKYHQPGVEPVIQITGLEAAHLTASGGNGVYQIQVSDNGIGFDEKYLDRIFQPFQRLHGRDEFEGTGMGLAICRKIVERHGGSITARSTPGGGTTFIIDLPTSQKSGEVTT